MWPYIKKLLVLRLELGFLLKKHVLGYMDQQW